MDLNRSGSVFIYAFLLHYSLFLGFRHGYGGFIFYDVMNVMCSRMQKVLFSQQDERHVK